MVLHPSQMAFFPVIGDRSASNSCCIYLIEMSQQSIMLFCFIYNSYACQLSYANITVLC